ncbi:glucose PTS transporter subunit IIA [Lacticaseibacillus mingshuiensis]|uniref:Glucose PTS transporter subunit IIA n=1 Tax=Lacticaseibacillus mingshuiensis TaxID=2799574 RepID=A0ABW4CDN3_9LACO|nr:glucose PTS transporter subunit IIA [Lacticaseibacillus mingshuiensis]
MGTSSTAAKQLLQALGGRDNIASVTRCATRLRFVLKNEALADKQAIEQNAAVRGLITDAGQFQLLIKNGCTDFYQNLVAVSGILGNAKASSARVPLLPRARGGLFWFLHRVKTWWLGARSPQAQKRRPTSSVPAASTSAATDLDYLYTPADGAVVPLSEVADQVFSAETVGQGFAVHPVSGHVFAPLIGTVLSVFSSKHALRLRMSNGLEVMVHMGLDTVELAGTPFSIAVEVGDSVTPTRLLAEMDLSQVKNSGRATDIVVILIDPDRRGGYRQITSGLHQHGERIAGVRAHPPSAHPLRNVWSA